MNDTARHDATRPASGNTPTGLVIVGLIGIVLGIIGIFIGSEIVSGITDLIDKKVEEASYRKSQK